MATIHAFMILSVNFLIATVGATSATNPKGLVTRLIHPNSIYSPHHNPNETVHDRAKLMVEISIARLGLLQKRSSSSVGKKIQTNMVASNGNYLFLMKFSIGQPPVPQLAVADTASAIAWVKCFPCDSCSTTHGDFDPTKSSTYSACHSCQELNISYVGGSTAKGVYIQEQLTFDDISDDGEITISDIYIGCGHEFKKVLIGESNGIFGLNSDSSIVRKFDHKLSYCVGNISDTQYSFNHISLGDDAIFEGDSTPLQANHYYFLTLEGISLGGELLDINPSVFNKDPYNPYGGVIIDSGTPLTWLARVAYHALCRKVRSILRGILTEASVQHFRGNLCYYGSNKKDLYGFPVLDFHFAQGTELVLDVDSMFIDFGDHFCLAFITNSNSTKYYQYENFTIIGMIAQQYYNVGYDITGRRLYLQRIECELLQD